MFLNYFKISLFCLAALFVADSSAQTGFGAHMMNEIAGIEVARRNPNTPNPINIRAMSDEQIRLFMDDLVVKMFNNLDDAEATMGFLLDDFGLNKKVWKIRETSFKKTFYHKPHWYSVPQVATGETKEVLRKTWQKNELLKLMSTIDEGDLVRQINYGIAETLNRLAVVTPGFKEFKQDADAIQSKFRTVAKHYSDFDFPNQLITDYEPGVGRITENTTNLVRKLLKAF